MLRKHQKEFSRTIDGIISGSDIKTIWCHVTPGGGKSLLPVLAGKLITSGLADKLIWIAPRLSLIDQAEREFINPHFRQALNHRLTIRSSTNEINVATDSLWEESIKPLWDLAAYRVPMTGSLERGDGSSVEAGIVKIGYERLQLDTRQD